MDSDATILIPPELSRLLHLRTMKFIGTERPWLNLYGNRVRPVSPYGSTNNEPVHDPALIHRSLPDELLMEVFARMGPYSLGRAACVCRKWRHSLRIPSFWRNACLKAWQLCGVAENYKLVTAMYGGSWRKMWLQRPRIRLDGIYVSRNTYIRAGVAEWKVTNPVHVVCYFRYLRFYPSGKFLYKITSAKIREVAKSMQLRALKPDSEIYKGDYILAEDQVEAALLYPGLCRTLLRMRLRLRGTTLGANNRMDLLKLVTTGVNESEVRDDDVDMLGVVQGWQEDETHDPDVPAVTHKRGMTPFVFVPFEEAETSELNLPVEKMDYYVPG